MNLNEQSGNPVPAAMSICSHLQNEKLVTHLLSPSSYILGAQFHPES